MHIDSAQFAAFSRTALEAAIPGVLMGVVAVGAVAIVLRRLGPLSASTRFVVWMATLISLPLMPVIYISGRVAHSTPAARVALPAAPAVVGAHREPLPLAAAADSGPAPIDVPVPRDMPLVTLGIYAVIVQLLLLRILAGYLRIRRLRRRTFAAPPEVEARVRHWLARCPTGRPFAIRLSHTARCPMAIGFRVPTIVMPGALVMELTEEEFDNLGVHELAHIRRFDDWTNLFQRVMHAFLFFHPAVYWVGRKLNFEREVASDDWVIAADGAQRYAECLAKVVELRRWHRGAMLSSGAFFGKRQILKRVELLLDKTRNAAPRPSGLVVAAITITLIGAALQISKLPAFVAITENNGLSHSTMRWTDGDSDLRLDMRGDLSFSPDERSIASVSPFGYVEIRETKGWTRRRLEVRPAASGAPEQRYFMNGREAQFDAAGRDWAATVYPFLIRELGIDVEARANRIFALRGAAGIREEVNLIRSDHVKRQYLEQLMEHAELSAEDLRYAATSARKISSDNEKAEFLIANAHRFAEAGVRTDYFHAVESINSDDERRRASIAMLEADGHSAKTASLAARAARSMGSDHEKAEVLLAVSNADGGDCDLLRSARTLNSDNDKARVLSQARHLESDRCGDAFFEVVNSIQADHERSTVLREMVDRPGGNAERYRGIALSAKGIQGDSDKAGVLASLSRYYTEPPFFNALRSIGSDNDRKVLLQALLRTPQPSAVLLEIVESASRLPADNDKAEILSFVAKCANDAEVRTAVKQACAKIGSDSDYRRVASVLLVPAGNEPVRR